MRMFNRANTALLVINLIQHAVILSNYFYLSARLVNRSIFKWSDVSYWVVELNLGQLPLKCVLRSNDITYSCRLRGKQRGGLFYNLRAEQSLRAVMCFQRCFIELGWQCKKGVVYIRVQSKIITHLQQFELCMYEYIYIYIWSKSQRESISIAEKR